MGGPKPSAPCNPSLTLPRQGGGDSGLTDRIPGLLTVARQRLRLAGGPLDRLAPAELKIAARAIALLHEGLVAERALAGTRYLDRPDLLGAYLLALWPLSYAKTREVLAPLALKPGGRVLDLGAGPGPMALAALDALGPTASAVACDPSAAALGALTEMSSRYSVETRGGDLSLEPAGVYNIVLLGNVLNELAADGVGRAALLRRIIDRNLAPGGVLVILDPALRSTGRDVLEVRDALLAAGGLVALAPCIRQGPCPALERARDWCHAGRAWEPPPLVTQLDEATGLDHRSLKFAYLVLGRAAEHVAPAVSANGLERFRVVSDPLVEKGKRRIFGCGERGRLPLVRLDREAPEGDPIAVAQRGDVVRVAGARTRGDGLRLGADSHVELEA